MFHWVTKLTWFVILIYRLVHFIFFCSWILIFKIVYIIHGLYSISSRTNLCTRGGLQGDRGPIPPSLKNSNLLNLAPYWKKNYPSDPTHPWKQLLDLRMLHGVLIKAYPVDYKKPKGKDKVFASIFLFYTLQLCRPSMQKSVVS